MNCALCAGYQAQKFDLKKRGIQKGYCLGCRVQNKQCAFLKGHCDLLKNNKVQFCFECGKFPCDRLKTLDKRYQTNYHMSEIENLLEIKKLGIKRFLLDQEKKWACPKCGNLICCHNGLCYNCDLEKLKAKKHKYRWAEE